MTSPVDLCNMALGQIPARIQITGINPASPPNNVAATSASLYYQTQVDATFRSAHWNSARKQAGLTLLAAAPGTPENAANPSLPVPPIPWLYEYAYPSDCLKIRFLFPLPSAAATGQVPLMTGIGTTCRAPPETSLPFVIDIDTDQDGNQIKVILTNAPRAQGVYTARIANPDLWDQALQNAVIGTLSAWLCMPVSGDEKKLERCIKVAAGLIAQARISDGNEGVTSMDHIPDWMEIRRFGSNAGWLGGGPSNGYLVGWDTWAGPDGISY
jgi:hypothetical protein